MNRQSFAYGMRALALVQNEGVMSSPSDIMVIGGQKTAARQQNNLVGRLRSWRDARAGAARARDSANYADYLDRHVFNHLAH